MLIPFTLLLLVGKGISGTITRFTNVECEVLDKSYCSYKQCNLKVLGRGIVGLNIHAKLLKGPFNNAMVNLSLWRKYNGYQPFMFNQTFDFCKMMANGKSKLTFPQIIADALFEKSNLNHSCPYDHDIIVRNMVFKEDHLRFLPLPSGQYKLQIMAATNKHWKTNINVHFMRTEDLITS